MALHRAIEAVAAAYPDRPALILDGVTVGYPALAGQVGALARALGRQGLAPGDAVGLTVAEPHRHLVASLALMRLGCAQVMLPSHEPDAVRQSVAARCGVAVALADDSAPATAGCEVLRPDFEAAFADAGPAHDLPEPDPDGLAIVLPSSGTTGRPKLVPLSQRQFLAQALNGRRVEGHETIYRPISIEHNNAKRMALYGLVLGATSVMVDASPAASAEICRSHGVDALMCSPVHARAMMDATPGETAILPAWTRLVVGGSAIAPEFLAEARARLTRQIHVIYGATECARVSIAGPDLVDAPAGSVGMLLPDVRVEIVDGDGRPLPDGETGEIRVRTPGMAERYVDDPESSARAFRDGWFWSGDAGAFAADGQLVFRGRQDDMMNLNSLKLFPAEIERAMADLPGIVECAAFPLRSPVHGDIPILAVVAEREIDLAAVLAFGRERLGIRAPRKIVLVDRLPRNATGKIVVSELRSLVAL